MSALARQPLWRHLGEYLKIEVYDRDGGHGHPRIRIEWKAMPQLLRQAAVQAIMPCVACGKPIHFVREREPAKRGGSGVGHLYYAPTCPLDVNIGCSRGAAARAEYAAVKAEEERRNTLPTLHDIITALERASTSGLMFDTPDPKKLLVWLKGIYADHNVLVEAARAVADLYPFHTDCKVEDPCKTCVLKAHLERHDALKASS